MEHGLHDATDITGKFKEHGFPAATPHLSLHVWGMAVGQKKAVFEGQVAVHLTALCEDTMELVLKRPSAYDMLYFQASRQMKEVAIERTPSKLVSHQRQLGQVLAEPREQRPMLPHLQTACGGRLPQH